jgi:hypothetical protein
MVQQITFKCCKKRLVFILDAANAQQPRDILKFSIFFLYVEINFLKSCICFIKCPFFFIEQFYFNLENG